MIHELVHQWWGLGNMFDASDESSPWSAEGLTVYTTYRIVKERYGPSYAQEHYVDQWQQEVDNYYLNFYVRNPDYLEALPEEERWLRSQQFSSAMRQHCGNAPEDFESGATGRRRGGHGPDPPRPVQPGAGSYVSI